MKRSSRKENMKTSSSKDIMKRRKCIEHLRKITLKPKKILVINFIAMLFYYFF